MIVGLGLGGAAVARALAHQLGNLNRAAERLAPATDAPYEVRAEPRAVRGRHPERDRAAGSERAAADGPPPVVLGQVPLECDRGSLLVRASAEREDRTCAAPLQRELDDLVAAAKPGRRGSSS